MASYQGLQVSGFLCLKLFWQRSVHRSLMRKSIHLQEMGVQESRDA